MNKYSAEAPEQILPLKKQLTLKKKEKEKRKKSPFQKERGKKSQHQVQQRAGAH